MTPAVIVEARDIHFAFGRTPALRGASIAVDGRVLRLARAGNPSADDPGRRARAVAAGLVASLLIVASTLPVLTRITGPETARTD